MLRILHTSDMHLKKNGEDSSYSLVVLDEIISIANTRQITHLLICGDLFDSFSDLSDSSLLAKVRDIFDKINPNCKIICITGNHELLGKSAIERIDAYNLGRIKFVSENVEFFTEAQAEFIAIPFSKSYTSLFSKQFPAKQKTRIVLLHGTDSTIYTGPDTEKNNEELSSAQIPDMLLHLLQADYAALGHIHEAREAKTDGTIAVYCGSPRVWRKGEFGPRKVICFSISDAGEIGPREEIVINSAGQYREISVPINLDGSIPSERAHAIKQQAANAKNDWFELVFNGIADDENNMEQAKKQLYASIAGQVRLCHIDTTAVEVLSALSKNTAARSFLDLMEKKKPASYGLEMDIWLKARILGLKMINDEAR